jgi:hypothetical protein
MNTAILCLASPSELQVRLYCVILGSIVAVALYHLAFAAVRWRYYSLPIFQNMTPNVSVRVPNPRGDLKGHPRHNYYTIRYDATGNKDVEIHGWRRGDFTYTSVHAYGWDSLPARPGHFRYDESLEPDGADSQHSNSSSAEKGDRYTVRLTTKPTFRAGVNEIDVSKSPTGLCLIRLIYPSAEEIQRCKPEVRAVLR